MLGDVNAKIKDGNLGIVQKTGEGVHFKIGSAAKNFNQILTVTAGMDTDKIKEKLGDTPLFNAVIDSLAAGCSTIHVIPVGASVPGSTGALKTEMVGKGTASVEGTPINEYDIVIEFQNDGGFNEATYAVSLDGGNTFSKKTTVPSLGTIDLGVGITLKLQEHTQKKDSFKAGDRIYFHCTAPKLSNENVLNALKLIKTTKLHFEYIHVVGESGKALWAALAIEMQEFFDKYKKPVFCVLEAAGMTTEQTLDTYVQAVLKEKENIVSRSLQVVPSRVKFTAKDGKIRSTPLANIICGLYARAKVNTSIGKVEEFPLNGVLGLLPLGIEDYIEILDEAGYTTARQYIGLEGYYISNSRSFASPTSDYVFMENVRTMYKAVREVRKQALYKMHMDIDPSEMETELAAHEKFLEIPLDAMVVDKEISKGNVIIDTNQNILGTSNLKIKVRIVPMGVVRNMEMEFALENPYLEQEA